MQRSIAAKYIPRPAASFVRPDARERKRRLGLRSNMSFQPARSTATVIRATRHGLESSSGGRIVEARRNGGGELRRRVRIEWVDLGRSERSLRSNLAPAPWRG